jgi:hypothetical protein
VIEMAVGSRRTVDPQFFVYIILSSIQVLNLFKNKKLALSYDILCNIFLVWIIVSSPLVRVLIRAIIFELEAKTKIPNPEQLYVKLLQMVPFKNIIHFLYSLYETSNEPKKQANKV